MNRTVTKVREIQKHDIADRLEQNKAKFKQYLIKQNWTETDMNTHKWKNDIIGYTVYGKITGKELINTNGVKIYPNGSVFISHFDQDGIRTRPMIYCTADKFTIF